jgi:hypothetical protein
MRFLSAIAFINAIFSSEEVVAHSLWCENAMFTLKEVLAHSLWCEKAMFEPELGCYSFAVVRGCAYVCSYDVSGAGMRCENRKHCGNTLLRLIRNVR